jgi:APA family basic amino acid/polyamine antiporter
MSEPRDEPGLHRELGVRSSTLLTAGAMIGTGIFVSPIATAKATTSAGWMLFAWLLGGALSLLGALSFAEAGSALPETGGLAVYLRRAFGDWAAFLFGWAMVAVLVPSSVAFFAQVAYWHLRDAGVLLHPVWPTVFIVALAAVNVAGLRSGARAQNALTVCKVVGVTLVAALGLSRISTGEITAAPVASRGSIPAFAAAMVPVLWAYDGWIDVTSVAGEVRDPRRTIPRAILGGTLLVTALYLLATLGMLAAFGHRGLASLGERDTVFTVGPWSSGRVRVALAALVAVASIGGGAVGLMSGARVVFAVARDGLLFSWLGRVSSRGVPANALIACSCVALAYVHSPLARLGEVFVLGAWPFYALGAVGVVLLRRRSQLGAIEDRAVFRTPLFPWPQIMFALVSVAIVVGYAAREPKNTAISLGAISAGMALFPWLRRRQKAQ